MSKLTKILYAAACFTASIYTYGQIRIVNTTANTSVQNSSAFIDASSNDSFNQSSNVGKGLLFPRTRLAGFTSFNGIVTPNPNNFPTLFDGMIVYNVDNGGVAGVGATEGTLCRGFWYYDRPTGPLNGGTWRPLATGCNIAGRITSLDCNDANIVRTGSLTAGVGASGATFTMTYTGGNGGVYSAQVIPSKGVTGLIAVLVADNFANGTGTLTYTIIGTPSGAGTALFDINIGGQQCPDVPFTVGRAPSSCGANIAPGVFQEFMCYNLGADTSLDPFTPTPGLGGDKYQWGRSMPAIIQAQDQANSGTVAGWNTTPAPDGSWSDTSKTANDPCPAGYRVPTAAQWQGIVNNNTKIFIGPWLSGAPYYDSGVNFGSNLMLLSASNRNTADGYRTPANGGFYWSSTANGANAGYLIFVAPQSGANVSINNIFRTWGFSVRCIKDTPSVSGSITSLDCNNIARVGTLTAGVAASNVSFTMTYGGGNGATYGAQLIPSTGVTGLTANLIAGNFNGTTLTYTITGTPSGAGTAFFDINIGGKQCLNVSFPVSGVAAFCGAFITPTEYKEFMCYNLGADTTIVDPLTPVAGLHGAKYQWGRGTPALTQALDQSNTGAIFGWNTTPAPDGSWLDASKTANDPCPAGYRVPTAAQWQGVLDNNQRTDIGTWTPGSYTAGIKFGSALMLPAAYNREYLAGAKSLSTVRGDYWSTTSNSSTTSSLVFDSTGDSVTAMSNSNPVRAFGFSVRCIKE